MSKIPDYDSIDGKSSEGTGNNETIINIETSTPAVKKNLIAMYHPTTAMLNYPRRC